MITVVITAAGGGVCQAVLRALRYGPLSVRTVGVDPDPMGVGLYWADAAYLVPPASDEEAYIRRLLEICSAERADALIPGSDPELVPLARHQDRFLRQGTRVIGGSPAAVELCRDKLALARFCGERGLPFVETWPLAEAREMLGGQAPFQFPVIVKPRAGSGSVGVRLVHDLDDLLRVPPEADFVVQRYMPPLWPGQSGQPAPSGRTGAAGRWSQRLDQSNEVSTQLLIGRSGEIIGYSLTINRLKDGVPMEVVPDPHPSGVKASLEVASALAAQGMRGPLNLTGRVTPDGVRFFEANPRFVGSTGARAALGSQAVHAALLEFVLERSEEARACLREPPDALVLRHVEETVVPLDRVERVRETGAGAVTVPLPPAPRRALITGSSCRLAAALAGRLAASAEAAGSPGPFEVGTLPGIEETQKRLRQALEGVDAVVHLAELRPAATDPQPPEELFRANTEGARILAEAARRAGVRRLVYLSTQEVYGGAPRPWSEALVPRPESAYALSKWIGEMACAGRGGEGTSAVILRAPPGGQGAAGGRSEAAGGEETREELCEAIARACALRMPPGGTLVLNVGGSADTRRARLYLGGPGAQAQEEER